MPPIKMRKSAPLSDRVIETGFYHFIKGQNEWNPYYKYQSHVGKGKTSTGLRWYPTPVDAGSGEKSSNVDDYAKKWLFAWETYHKRHLLPESTDERQNEDSEKRAIAYFWGGTGSTLESRTRMEGATDRVNELVDFYVKDAQESTKYAAKEESNKLLALLLNEVGVEWKYVKKAAGTTGLPDKWHSFKNDLKVDSTEEMGLKILAHLNSQGDPTEAELLKAIASAAIEGRKGPIDVPAGSKMHGLIVNQLQSEIAQGNVKYDGDLENLMTGWEITQETLRQKLLRIEGAKGLLGNLTGQDFEELQTMGARIETLFKQGISDPRELGMVGEATRGRPDVYNFGAQVKDGYAGFTVFNDGVNTALVPFLIKGGQGDMLDRVMVGQFLQMNQEGFRGLVETIFHGGAFQYGSGLARIRYIGTNQLRKSYARGVVTRVSTIAPDEFAQAVRGIIQDSLNALADELGIIDMHQSSHISGPFANWVEQAENAGKRASWKGAMGRAGGWKSWLGQLLGISIPTPEDYVDYPSRGQEHQSDSEPPIKLRPFVWIHRAGLGRYNK
jgi:hypothetical protein